MGQVINLDSDALLTKLQEAVAELCFNQGAHLIDKENSRLEEVIVKLRKLGKDSYSILVSPGQHIVRTWGREEDAYGYFLFTIAIPFSTSYSSCLVRESTLKESQLTGDYCYYGQIVPQHLPDFEERRLFAVCKDDIVGNILADKQLKIKFQHYLSNKRFMNGARAKIINLSQENDSLSIDLDLVRSYKSRYSRLFEAVNGLELITWQSIQPMQ